MKKQSWKLLSLTRAKSEASQKLACTPFRGCATNFSPCSDQQLKKRNPELRIHATKGTWFSVLCCHCMALGFCFTPQLQQFVLLSGLFFKGVNQLFCIWLSQMNIVILDWNGLTTGPFNVCPSTHTWRQNSLPDITIWQTPQTGLWKWPVSSLTLANHRVLTTLRCNMSLTVNMNIK